MQNVFYSVVHMMKNQTIEELEKVLTVLHFDSNVEISFEIESSNSELKAKDVYKRQQYSLYHVHLHR